MDQPPPIEKYKRALERIRISCEEMAQVFQALHDTPSDAMDVEEVEEVEQAGEGGEGGEGGVQSISVLSEMSVFKDLQAVAGSVKNLQESVHTTKVWIDFLEICGSEQQIQLGFFGFLPDELIIHIFGFLDPFSLCRCACVSHTWNVLSADEKLWEQKTKMAYPDIREIFTQIKKPWKWIFQSKYFLPGEPRDGCGWHVLPNGNRFYGDWKSDKRHGWGVNVISNGRIYEGEYVEDKRNGWGVFRWPGGEHAGDTYIGEWKDSKRHGHGRYTWADGRVYDGKWQNDKRAGGRSTYPTCADGQCYEGEYRHGKRHGTGTTTYPTGEVFHGQFVTNKRSGLGSLRWPDGAKFEGQWHRGRRNGPGLLVLPDGRTFSQFWSEETFNMDDRGLDSPYAKCQEVDPAESRFVRIQNNGEMLKFPRAESPDTKSSDSGESTDMDT